jgi:PIN domain nuclease of toxin-antitoxin system
MASRLLLDTCAVLWMAQDVAIAPEAQRQIDGALMEGRSIGVSAITAWELGQLSRKGRLAAAVSPQNLFNRFVQPDGIEVEPLTPSILIDSSFLPGDFHNDPADRIIVATARAFALTVVTRDHKILAYARQGHVLALAC